MTPRLKWRRRMAGRYVAGPYRVTRLPHHRPIWECTKLVGPTFTTQAHIGNYGTAADAKQAAADDHATMKGTA